MTESEEKYLFKLFSDNYNEMPLGTVEFDDKPDVILNLKTGERIGIELTECIYNQDMMMQSEFEIKFNQKVIAKLEDLLPFKFLLDVELDKNIPLKQNQIEATINGIVEVCLIEFINLNSNESRSVEQLDVDWNSAPVEVYQHFYNLGYRKLPKGILNIQISRFDGLSKSHHPESKGGVVPDFTAIQLNQILKKKEKSLKNYKPCTQQWLVICEGGDFYSYMKNIDVKENFKTSFDKVFLYKRWDSEVIILK